MPTQNKLHWFIYCLLVFALSRALMVYAFSLANAILHHHNDFFSSMCRWDCKWYLTIIDNGYDLHRRVLAGSWHNLANWAFFPLYPYTIRLLASLTGLSALMCGVLFNQVVIFAALLLFYQYLNLFVDDHDSRFGVLLVAFSPFSIYFASLYTEALFFLLSLLAFYSMRTRHPVLSALCGGLLSATRPIGVMFSLPFFCYQLCDVSLSRKRIIQAVLLSGIALSGLFIYMFYLQLHVGDYLAFAHIQRAWGRDGFSEHHLGRQLWQMISDSHDFMLFAISVALSIYLLVKSYWPEALFNLLCVLPGAITGTMMSEGRFAGTLFTLYFALTLIARKSHNLKFVIIVVFMLLYLSYFLYWMAYAKFLI